MDLVQLDPLWLLKSDGLKVKFNKKYFAFLMMRQSAAAAMYWKEMPCDASALSRTTFTTCNLVTRQPHVDACRTKVRSNMT